MNIRQVYEAAVEHGISQDPRGRAAVRKQLARVKEQYDKLKGFEKEVFDLQRLTNPYADTRVLNEMPDELKRVLVGIDAETPELVLVDRLRERGRKIDGVIAHHPEGHALAGLADVMGVQTDIWVRFGVSVTVADAIMAPRAKEVGRRIKPTNTERAVTAAKMLGIPYMCMHTPADNCVSSYLQKMFDSGKHERVSDVLDELREIPEYRAAAEVGQGPTLFTGSAESRCGRIFVDMTGGTEGPETLMEKLAAAGVGTVVHMHLGDKGREQAEKHHLNVVIAGHTSSDSVGLNLLADEIERRGGPTIEGFSGFTRVRRTKGRAKKAAKKASKKAAKRATRASRKRA